VYFSRKLVTPLSLTKNIVSLRFLPPTPSLQHRATCIRSVRLCPSISSPRFLSVVAVEPGVRSPSIYEFSKRHPFRGKSEILDPIFQCPLLSPWLSLQPDERRHDRFVMSSGKYYCANANSRSSSLTTTSTKPAKWHPRPEPSQSKQLFSPPRSGKPGCCHSRLTILCAL